MYFFNAITGQVKKIPKSIIISPKDWEYFYENKDDITVELRKKLINQTVIDDEIFKLIPGSDCYYVSNYGRVKIVYRTNKKERLLVPYIRKNKFICVKVKIDNKYKEFRITYLVARCFKIEGKGKRIIHVNKNIWDNSVPNLKYVDQKSLIKIPHRKGRHAIIKLDAETLEELDYYPSIREAGRREFLSHEAIRMCLKGNQKTAGGFKWIYDTD